MEKESEYTDGSSAGSRLQEMGAISRACPLSFAVRVNGEYYVSFPRGKFWTIVVRAGVWAVVNAVLFWWVSGLAGVGAGVVGALGWGLAGQVGLFLALSLLDGGTLFEDEEDALGEERTLCMTCSLYRLRSSRHCIWCNRCARKYDHHCSVFGKCIAARNLLLFYAFILLCGLEFPALIVTLVAHLTADT